MTETNANVGQAAGGGECPVKPAPAAESSPISAMRRVLPLAAFFVAFMTVMSVLLVYMDTTAMRHHQFRINMTQDYDLFNVAQDDPMLVTYIREVLIRPAIDPNHHRVVNSSMYTEPSHKTLYVAKLLGYKKNGVYVETGAYKYNRPSDTEWLEKNLSWSGLLLQPDPRDYFGLRRHGRGKSQSIHACVSPTCYPKEITFHQDERDGVKINSIHANSVMDDDWFNTRVKCFPLFSLLLAINCTTIDYLSLESDGSEMQVLVTIPFNRVKIEIIDIQLPGDNKDIVDSFKQAMVLRNYKFMQNFNSSYVFMSNHINVKI